MANFQGRYDVLANGNFVYYSDTIPSALGTGITGQVGDYCVVTDMTGTGSDAVWRCIVAGSPGTWIVAARGEWVMTIGPLAATDVSMGIPTVAGTWKVASVRASATVKGGTGATVTVETLTGTTAPGSGTAQLSAALIIDATYTANTVLTGTLITTPTAITGGSDKVGIVLAGTLTGLVNLFVTIGLRKYS